MSQYMGLMIESLVAVLLVLTVGYCALLNKRLKRLKADEHSLKATISELITATEIAERAIGGLKVTVRECDESLGSRLAASENLVRALGRQIESGENLLARITRIATAGQSALASTEDKTNPQSVLAAAQAFAGRQRTRTGNIAA